MTTQIQIYCETKQAVNTTWAGLICISPAFLQARGMCNAPRGFPPDLCCWCGSRAAPLSSAHITLFHRSRRLTGSWRGCCPASGSPRGPAGEKTNQQQKHKAQDEGKYLGGRDWAQLEINDQNPNPNLRWVYPRLWRSSGRATPHLIKNSNAVQSTQKSQCFNWTSILPLEKVLLFGFATFIDSCYTELSLSFSISSQTAIKVKGEKYNILL